MATFKPGDTVRLHESLDVDGTTVSPMIVGEIVEENSTIDDYWFIAFDLEFRDRVETVATWVMADRLYLV